jgi:hypothetical protein
VDSTPRAYRLKASNAAPLISTSVGTFPKNLTEYFHWCWAVRNAVVHAEVYPAFLVSKNDLNLVRRRGKQSSELEYLTFSVATLREYADKIEAGRMQAARINLHLRYRATPPKRRSAALRTHGYEPLPKTLPIPAPMEARERPRSGQVYLYPPSSSRAKS